MPLEPLSFQVQLSKVKGSHQFATVAAEALRAFAAIGAHVILGDRYEVQ